MVRLGGILALILVVIVAVFCGIAQRKGSAYAVFMALEIILCPVTGVGVSIVVGASVMHVRHTGMSLTALGPLLSRYLLHEVGTREDIGAKAISESLLPAVGLHALLGPTVWAFKTSQMPPKQVAEILGYPPGTLELSSLRMAVRSMGIRAHFIDRALEEFSPTMDQLVVLGAGFDTKIYRQGYGGLKIFEVDTNRTQPMKKQMLASSPLDTTRITFLEVDFNVDDWLAKLKASGFDSSKRTFFLWEGVTMYLPTDVVKATLSKMATCGSGSILAFDYISSDLVHKHGLLFGTVRVIFSWIGEPLLFGISMDSPARSHTAALLEQVGLHIVRHSPVIPGFYGMAAAVVP